jgi:glucose/arabinose dehydrogenase
VPIGARVSFASLKPDGTGDKAEVFAEGWLNENGAYDGRPVDVAQLPDGSLIVSDDFAGALYGSLMKEMKAPCRPNDPRR